MPGLGDSRCLPGPARRLAARTRRLSQKGSFQWGLYFMVL